MLKYKFLRYIYLMYTALEILIYWKQNVMHKQKMILQELLGQKGQNQTAVI